MDRRDRSIATDTEVYMRMKRERNRERVRERRRDGGTKGVCACVGIMIHADVYVYVTANVVMRCRLRPFTSVQRRIRPGEPSSGRGLSVAAAERLRHPGRIQCQTETSVSPHGHRNGSHDDSVPSDS